jgi:hypothetical protein
MFLETLDTKKLFANGLAIIPWQFRLNASEDAEDERLQANLSSFATSAWILTLVAVAAAKSRRTLESGRWAHVPH